MGKQASRSAGVVILLAVASMTLVACGASSSSGPQVITDWLDAHGVPCRNGGSYDSVTVSAVPFTRVTCDGVQLDSFDTAATDRYDAFWAADCAATPVDERTGLETAVVVRGPTWVLRGQGPDGPDSWPQSLVGAAGVTPDAAAEALGGQAVTVAEVCRDLGAWTT